MRISLESWLLVCLSASIPLVAAVKVQHSSSKSKSDTSTWLHHIGCAISEFVFAVPPIEKTNRLMHGTPPFSRHVSDPRVVISLTTVPDGVGSVSETLDSLRNQTVPPDAIELNLPYESKRGLGKYGDLPPQVARGVDVHRTDDWLALTNIIPTVQRAKASATPTLVIVVDDDKSYPRTLVEDHLRAHRLDPRSASTCRGYRIPAGGHISHSFDEIAHSFYGHALGKREQVAILTGSDSWSVLAELFPDSLWEGLPSGLGGSSTSAERLAPGLMNDIWVSGILSQVNVTKFAVPCQSACEDVAVRKTDGVTSFDVREHASEKKVADKTRRVRMNEIVTTHFTDAWKPEETLGVVACEPAVDACTSQPDLYCMNSCTPLTHIGPCLHHVPSFLRDVLSQAH